MDGLEMITSNDMVRIVALQAVSRKVSEFREEEREQLADMIVDKFAKAWNNGQKK